MQIVDIVHVHQLKKKQDLIWHQRYHKHEKNQYEFHYFLEGEGSLLIEKKSHPFKKHELFLTPPEVLHAVQSKNSYISPISYYAILFKLEQKDKELKKILDNPDFNAHFPFKVSHSNRLIFKILLTQRMQEQNKFLHQAAEYKLYSYLYELFATHLHRMPQQESSPKNNGEHNHHIDKAINYMNRSIYENISIATIALHIGISTEYLIRIFKLYLNITPYQYFIQIKIEQSCGLLTNTNMKIHEIAEKLQFSNASNFTRTFIKQIGISPTAYRNTYLHKSGILAGM